MSKKKEYWDISKLHEWDKNPRGIKKKDFDRLKKQIQKLGQYKPLIITPDGEVLGGNMRLKAYRDLGMDDLWVSVVKPKDENEKLEYALSDNDRAGYYDADLLANLMPQFDIDWSSYSQEDGKDFLTAGEKFRVIASTIRGNTTRAFWIGASLAITKFKDPD